MSKEVINNGSLKKLVEFYFSKCPTIDFSQVKQMTKKFKKDINRYSNFAVPSWVENRAKTVSVNTLNFIKNNKYLLSPSKKSITYQEYQQLLQFKSAIQNLEILSKETIKINSIKKKKIEGKIIKVIAIFIFSVSLYFLKMSFTGEIQLIISIALIIFLVFCMVKKNKIQAES